jgi:hypothetical protein
MREQERYIALGAEIAILLELTSRQDLRRLERHGLVKFCCIEVDGDNISAGRLPGGDEVLRRG